MKKGKIFIIIAVVFISSLLYLHQKIQIFVEAYQLSANFSRYNELVDKRDYLMYNFTKEISIARVNEWAQRENFEPVSSEKMLALGPTESESVYRLTFTALLDRFLGASATTSTALAKENE